MKLLLKAKYIIFSLIFIVILFVGTKFGWLVQRYTFAQAVQTPIAPSAELFRDLARCTRSCTMKDQEYAQRFAELLTPIEQTQKSLPEQLPEIRKILIEATNSYIETGDVKSAADMYMASMSLDNREDLEASKDAVFTTEVYKGVEQLAFRFPRNGHVYEVLGHSRLQQNPRDEKAVAAFKKCLSILPTEASCEAGYAQAVKSYTEPYCEGANVSPQLKITTEKLPDLVLNSVDIFEMLPGPAKGDGEDSVSFRMTPAGLKKLRELPRQEGILLDISIDQNSIGTVRVPVEPISGSSFIGAVSKPTATTADKHRTLFETLCLKTTNKVLSKNLKL